jgi:hypothetical protein
MSQLQDMELEMAIIGYARVSTQDHDLSGELAALRTVSATKLYREKSQRRPGRSAGIDEADVLPKARRRGRGHQS